MFTVPKTIKIWAAIALELLILTGGSGLAHMLAQATVDPLQQTQAATTAATVTIISLDPTNFTSGQVTVLSINGTNFTAGSTVNVVGFGPLSTAFVNNTLLRVTLPNNLAGGQYFVQVTDPIGGQAVSPGPFTVVAAATLTPTTAPISVSRSE